MTDINTTYSSFMKLDNSYASIRNQNSDDKLRQAREIAEDFEAFFMTKTMESMFEGISTEGMFGGGHAEKIYRSLLLNEYGKVMAKTGTVGIADSVMDTIIQMQEAQSSNAL